ncbi:MAG: CRISPR-associated protein Cas4 [Pseudomonadota bacterium]
MPEEEHLIPLSALQHYSYCPRQCALIHQEQSFDENLFTLRGRRVHERVDAGETTTKDGVRVERSLPLYSETHGLIGKADVVELLMDGTPYPVEYKHGPRRAHEHDELQLAAQAICLEEMTGKPVPKGAIYHHSSHRRREVEITTDLRQQVIETAEAVRSILESGKPPPPTDDRGRCRGCSLYDLCQPELIGSAKRLHAMRQTLFTPEQES